MKKIILHAIGILLFFSCQNEQSGKKTIVSESNKEHVSSSVTSVDTNFSRFIPKDSANKMIGSYLTSINATSNDSSLRSVVIDVKQLRRYIDSMPGSGEITKIKLMFGHTLNYINTGHSGQNARYTSGELTLIISAYDVSGNYVYYNSDEVIDFGMPCPSNCPPGTAAGPLLQ
jgi:hypothetical protein